MPRSLFRIVLGLAIAVGLSFAIVGPRSASAAPVAPTAVSSQATQAAAADCSDQQQRVRSVRSKLSAAKQALRKAKRQLRGAKANHNAAKVQRLKKRVRTLQRRIRRLRNSLGSARAALYSCQNQSAGTDSPIQALCDAGVPQNVCDELAALVPGGGTPDGVSLDALCTAVPEAQPICDAFAGGTPDPTTLLTIVQGVLLSLGLPGLPGLPLRQVA